MPKKAPSGKKNAESVAKNKAQEAAIDQIRTKYGEGSIMRLGDVKALDVKAITTGSISLDIALGVGGIPKGRVIEIYGMESSGKTTLAEHIDAEHALDPEYAKKTGVNIDSLLISQPDTGEQALEIVETLVRSNAVDVIVIDSVAALTPRAEIEGDMGDSHMGLQARLMSQALRKLTAAVSKTNTTVIVLNQIRIKIGVMFGNPEETTGGKALKFYSSVRIELRRSAQLKLGDKIIGNRIKTKVVKNKVAPPFQRAEFDIMWNEGISRSGDILDTGAFYKIIDKSGAWYTYKGEKIGQGREASSQYLRENPKMMNEIEKVVWQAVEEERREQ